MSAVSSATVRLSSTRARAVSSRSLAAWETSPPPVHIGDPLAQRQPVQYVFRPALLGPVPLDVPSPIEGGFASPKHASPFALGFVIELRRVLVHAELGPFPLRPAASGPSPRCRQIQPECPPTGSPGVPSSAARRHSGNSASHGARTGASAAAKTPPFGTLCRWPTRSADRSNSNWPGTSRRKWIHAAD